MVINYYPGKANPKEQLLQTFSSLLMRTHFIAFKITLKSIEGKDFRGWSLVTVLSIMPNMAYTQ